MLTIIGILLTFGLSGHSGSCVILREDGTDSFSSPFGTDLGPGSSLSKISQFTSISRGSRRGGGGGGRKHLHLYGVEVPVYKFRGEDAQLECKYDPGNDPLYSVKWYKDDNEFYRYLFGKQPPKQIFPIPGVVVDVHRSNERRVLLKELTFNSTGIYRCEVSADSPHFRTYDNHSVMVIVELPERGPTISGGRSHYRVGETAALNCTSSRSKPAATLTWFINDEQVKPSQLVPYFPRVHEDGLESRRLGLSFTVDDSHFLKGDLFLKCQATVAAIYSATEEEGATVFEGKPLILEQRENLIHVRSGSRSTQHLSYGFMLTFLLLMIQRAVT